NCPVVAYSGEIDRQKQAADMMATAMKSEGLELAHIIGPKTAHAYHPQAKVEISRRIDSIVARGRDPLPRHIRFQTYTLRYNQMHWLTVEGLGTHWEPARVEAELRITGPDVSIKSNNVTALTLSIPP